MDPMQHEYGMKVVEDDNIINNQQSKHQELDSPTALQLFLNRIPVSSIPSIKTSPVVELKIGDSVKDAIRLLYEKNVYGAAIADTVPSDTTFGRFSENYMGFIHFSSLVLWSLEQCEQAHVKAIENGGDENSKSGFFTMLEHNPEIGQTKVGELAKSFLWNPFLPARLEDTLFHVLLLLSKHHHLKVVPVLEKSNLKVVGFVTQNAVVQLLLQSSGLEWFDGIADKALSEFRFVSEERIIRMYGDQSLAEALRVFWESRIGAVAVVNRDSENIIGCVTKNNVHLLLRNNDLVKHREDVTIKEFVHMETVEEDAPNSAGALNLRSSLLPRMCSPITAKRSDTLKQAMSNLVEANGSSCFVVDDMQEPIGMLTLRDIIIEFAPPCMDSGIHGGSFFDYALEQTGCQIKNGTIVCDH